MEPLARRIGQRQSGQGLHPGVRRLVDRQHVPQRLLVRIGDRADGGEVVGQARPVREQVVEGDRARGVIDLVQRSLRVLQHLHVGELGRPLGDRVVQLELALFHQHQRRHGGHRLGHRRDPEQGVSGHRLVPRDVAPAGRADLGDLALAPDQGDRSRQVAGADDPLQNGRRPRQRLEVKTAQRRARVIHACAPGGVL